MKALLALLFAIAAAVTGPVALFAYNAESRFLSPGAAKALIDEAGFYADLPKLAADGAREEPPEFAAGASEEDLTRFFDALLTRDAMRPYVEHAVDQFVAFARGETEAAVISSTELQRALIERAPDAVMSVVAGKPECTRPDSDAGQPVLSCRPRAADEASYRARVAARVADGVKEIPESFQAPPDAQSVAEFERDFPRALRAQLVQAAAWGWAFPGCCLVLLAMLYSQSRRGMAAWVGVPTLIAGLISLACAKGLEQVWAEAVAEIRTEAAEPGEAFAARITEALGRAFFEPMLLQASIVAALGAMLVAAAFMLHDEDTTTGPWPG